MLEIFETCMCAA